VDFSWVRLVVFLFNQSLVTSAATIFN